MRLFQCKATILSYWYVEFLIAVRYVALLVAKSGATISHKAAHANNRMCAVAPKYKVAFDLNSLLLISQNFQFPCLHIAILYFMVEVNFYASALSFIQNNGVKSISFDRMQYITLFPVPRHVGTAIFLVHQTRVYRNGVSIQQIMYKYDYEHLLNITNLPALTIMREYLKLTYLY